MILPYRIRASNADARFTCGGSLTLSPLVPERVSDEGIEGSVIHYEIAVRAVKELSATPPDGGLVPPSAPDGYKLPAFSAWIPDWGINFIKRTVPDDWALLVEVEYEETFRLPRPVWVPEAEIVGKVPAGTKTRFGKDGMEFLVEEVTLTGHEDWRAISPDGTMSVSGDWKTGLVGADAADSNWQASQYMVLGKEAWPTIRKSVFWLPQPRIDEELGVDKATKVSLEGDELERMRDILVEKANQALEKRFQTDSTVKGCRYCNVAANRPWACPSLIAEQKFMKATIDSGFVEAAAKPSDGLLGDFVIAGQILTEPLKSAKEQLHERLDKVTSIVAGCGATITRTIRPGAISIPDKTKFREAVEVVLPDRKRQDKCIEWSKKELIREIAAANGYHQAGDDPVTGTSIYEAHLKPLTKQGESRILVVK